MNIKTTNPMKKAAGHEIGLSKKAAYKSKPTVNVIQAAVIDATSLGRNK